MNSSGNPWLGEEGAVAEVAVEEAALQLNPL